MKKLFLILSVLAILVACNNSKKNQSSESDSDSVAVVSQNTDPDSLLFKIIEFDGTPTFDDFLSFFPVLDAGTVDICGDNCDTVLSQKFNKLSGIDLKTEDSLFISPRFKKKINDFTLLFFTVLCPDSVFSNYLATYDNSNKLIDSISFEINPDDFMNFPGALFYLSESNNFSTFPCCVDA